MMERSLSKEDASSNMQRTGIGETIEAVLSRETPLDTSPQAAAGMDLRSADGTAAKMFLNLSSVARRQQPINVIGNLGIGQMIGLQIGHGAAPLLKISATLPL